MATTAREPVPASAPTVVQPQPAKPFAGSQPPMPSFINISGTSAMGTALATAAASMAAPAAMHRGGHQHQHAVPPPVVESPLLNNMTHESIDALFDLVQRAEAIKLALDQSSAAGALEAHDRGGSKPAMQAVAYVEDASVIADLLTSDAQAHQDTPPRFVGDLRHSGYSPATYFNSDDDSDIESAPGDLVKEMLSEQLYDDLLDPDNAYGITKRPMYHMEADDFSPAPRHPIQAQQPSQPGHGTPTWTSPPMHPLLGIGGHAVQRHSPDQPSVPTQQKEQKQPSVVPRPAAQAAEHESLAEPEELSGQSLWLQLNTVQLLSDVSISVIKVKSVGLGREHTLEVNVQPPPGPLAKAQLPWTMPHALQGAAPSFVLEFWSSAASETLKRAGEASASHLLVGIAQVHLVLHPESGSWMADSTFGVVDPVYDNAVGAAQLTAAVPGKPGLARYTFRVTMAGLRALPGPAELQALSLPVPTARYIKYYFAGKYDYEHYNH